MSTAFGYVFRWGRDGRAIDYVDTRGGVSNIWRQPLDVNPLKQLTDFKSELIFWFDWSHDSKQLALVRNVRSSNVVLINASGKSNP